MRLRALATSCVLSLIFTLSAQAGDQFEQLARPAVSIEKQKVSYVRKHVRARKSHVRKHPRVPSQYHALKNDSGGSSGIASIYSGGRTANGEQAHAGRLTAAHRTLPFGSMVQVTNTKNGRSVVVRINDRGPFIRGRIIDVTPAGARALGFAGLAPVRIAVLGKANRKMASN
jgi:rare lipoprotein A